MNINTVIIGGNLTADPEVKYLPSGTAAGEFTVAVNENWKDDGGNKMEKTHFIRCFCFGKTAENIAKYFKKGQRILVEGALAQDAWEDKETGKKREKTRVKVMGFHFIERGEKRDDNERETHQQKRKPPIDPDLDSADPDDIPF